MMKFFSGIVLSLTAFTVLADEKIAVVAPRLESDPTGLILFALAFLGLIGGYAFVIWKNEKKKKGAVKDQ